MAYVYPFDTPEQQHADAIAGDVSWTDYAKTLAAGATDVAGALPASARFLGESMPDDSLFGQLFAVRGRHFGRKLNETAADLTSSMGEPAQARALATLGSTEFWQHPLSAVALKSTRTAPSIAASIGATLFTGGGAPALAALAGVSGGLSAGETLDDVYAAVDGMSDKDLRKNSTLYNGYRDMGLSEDKARKELNRAMIGYKPAGLFALGAITGVVGPEGQIANALGLAGLRDVAGKLAEHGIAKRVGSEALQGFGAEFVQTGAEQLVQEQSGVDAGLQSAVDVGRVGSAALEGGVLGGVFGGFAGIPRGPRAKVVANKAPVYNTTNANPRPAAINPPAAAVAVNVTGPVSMPARAGNTQGTPGVVPAATPTGTNKTIPGKAARDRKSSKKGAPATPVASPATVAPIEPATEALAAPATPIPGSPVNAPTGLLEAGNVPSNTGPSLVMDEAQQLALNQGKPRTPSQVQQQAGVPYGEAARVAEGEGWQAPQVPTQPVSQARPLPSQVTPAPEITPAPSPQASVAPASQAEGFGAGTIAVPPPVSPLGPASRIPGAEPAPGFGAGTIAVPAPTEEPAPTNADRAALAVQLVRQKAAETKAAAAKNKADKRTGGHDKVRAAQVAVDAKIAQRLLDTRPKEIEIPKTGNAIAALQGQFQSILDQAREAGVKFRKRVGHETTPDHIVWLRALETVNEKLKSERAKPEDQISAVMDFLDDENKFITTGTADAFRSRRQRAGEAIQQTKQAGTGTVEGVSAEDVQTKPSATARGPVKLEEHTTERKIKLKGGTTQSYEVAEAANEGRSRADLVAEYNAKLTPKITPKVEAVKAKVEAKAPAPTTSTPLPSKVTPKVEAVKTRVSNRKKLKTIEAPKPSGKAALAEELAKIEPKPSDAQIEADNAAKGHVSIEGLPIAIATKKNTERQGVAPGGRRWNWLYKHHYGHILGTKAPDGAPVDIFLGPKAWPGNPLLKDLPVVVVDQVDPDTKAPDEPKVMFGFDTVVDAVNAYDDSYPRGAERRGDVTPMSLEEFKAWVRDKTATKEPAGALASDTDPAIRGVNSDPGKAPGVNRQFERYKENAELTKKIAPQLAVSSGKLSDYLGNSVKALRAHDWVDPVSKAMFGKFASRIKDMAGEVTVYVVPKDAYLDILGRSDGEIGYYSHGADIIIFNEAEVSRGMTDPEVSSYVLHEAAHAAFMKAIYASPKLHAHLRDILIEARNASLGTDWEGHYGLTDIDELLAEALSNAQFQMFLARTDASKGLKARLGLGEKVKSIWDVVVRLVGEALRLPNVHNSLLSAVMKVAPHLELLSLDMGPGVSRAASKNIYMGRLGGTFYDFSEPGLRLPDAINDRLPSKVRTALKSDVPQQEQLNAPWMLGMRTTDHLAQLAKQFGAKFGKPMRDIANINEAIPVTTHNFEQAWLPLAKEMREAEHEFRGTEWENFINLLHDESSAGADSSESLTSPKNKHLGKDSLAGAYGRARWVELNQRWSALDPKLKALRLKLLDFYSARQADMSFGAIKNILRAAGHNDDALAQRLFDDTATQADIDQIGPRLYDHINDANALKKLKGPYYPQMRRGDYVAQAKFKIKPPTNALRAIPDDDGNINTWEFAGQGARKQAMDYAAAQNDLHPSVSSVWVDSNTGERYYTDANGKEQRVSPQDADAENRFRVTIENRFVDFYETAREAREVAQALKSDPRVETDSVKGVEERRFEPGDRRTDMLSYHMRQLAAGLENSKNYDDLSDREKNQVQQTLREVSLRMMGSTRIQTRRLPRKHVLGASRDAAQGLVEYTRSAAGYLSRLKHQQDLDAAMKAAEQEVGTDEGKAFGRRALFNEMQKRINVSSAYNAPGKWDQPINRLLITSYASRLISPATNMLNMLQPTTTSLPLMAARFGPGRASAGMLKVYRDINTGKILKAGAVATKRALIQGSDAELPSIIDDIKARLKDPQERAAIDYWLKFGSLDPDAGIETKLLYSNKEGLGGKVDRGLDYLQRFGRQMPRSIEAVNRAVTGILAFRLEMAKNGGDFDAAVQFAQETINMTQGIYSRTNASPIFNHPLGRLTLQFKQYAQVIYGLIGHQVGKAYRNAEPGDRAEALKSLGYMVALQTMVAGSLGLPTEPAKWLLMGAGALGLPVPTPEEVEAQYRELMASALGKQLGEIASRGITRALPDALAFDLSSRAGYQDLLTFGEFRSNDPQDIYSYFGNLIGGAPAALFMDWVKGSQEAVNGDFAASAQHIAVLKVASDLVKAYRGATEGKKTGAGFQSMTPYSLGEAAVRGFGFTPAREAETTEQSRYFYSEQKQATTERDTFLQQWATTSGTERAKLWGQIEKHNYKKTADERLTRADLDRYAKSRRAGERSRVGGLRVTRRERALAKRLQGVYGTD